MDNEKLISPMTEAADLVRPMSLRIAATLRLVDLAGDQGATAAELAAKTKVNAMGLSRLLDHLVTLGVFTRSANGDRYLVTDWGSQLREDAPDPLRPGLDMNSALGRAQMSVVELMHCVCTGQPAYPQRYGRGFWEDLESSPELRDSFDATMRGRIQVDAKNLAEQFDWSVFNSVVDVGGGDATVLCTLLRRYSHLRGQVLELPGTAELASARLDAEGLAGRAKVVAGSFFDPLPSGADAYLLSDIVHNWSDDDAVAILRRCAAALAPGGSVLVVETMRDGNPGQAPNTWMDLNMWAFLGGRERTRNELDQLAAQCGLSPYRYTQIGDWRGLLELRRNGE